MARTRTHLIAPLTAPTFEGMRSQVARAADGGADMVECRIDYLGATQQALDLRALIDFVRQSPLPLIATLRPVRQGGRFAGDEASRLAILRDLAPHAAAVDVEDDVPVEHRPAAKTLILSHHDLERCPADLGGLVRRLADQPCEVVKVAFAADDPVQALAALEAVRDCPKPAIVLAMGEAGLISRVLAPKAGAWGTFAALDADSGSAPGQPTLDQMGNLYHWDRLGVPTACFGVVGCPVAHSMSPAIHNAALAAAGIDGVYLPVRVEVGQEAFTRFVDAVRGRQWLGWRGLSVTIPHKENALRYVGSQRCEELTRRIGAVNTITLDAGGGLRGDNTDYSAALDALCDGLGIARADLADQAVAVLGAGGAARAVVAGLRHYSAQVTIYNRGAARAEELAGEFGCQPRPWDQRHRMDERIIVNCTPIGMHPHAEQSPLDAVAAGTRAVFDTIYTPLRTRLLLLAELGGAKAVSGLEMFVNQAVAQFERWTHRPAPRELMREVTLRELELSGRQPAGGGSQDA